MIDGLQIESATDCDIPDLLRLFEANSYKSLSPEENTQFGFVSLTLSSDLLQRIIRRDPPIVAKVDGRLIAYLIPLPHYFRDDPDVKVIFDADLMFSFEGRPIADYQFVQLTQVAIDREFRGRGVYQGMYEEMRRRYADTYDLVLVGISKYNSRSLRAHQKLGFLHVGEVSMKCPREIHERCESRLAEDLSESCLLAYAVLYHAWES
jgi:predicted GNAT superfamily acetyltransferase